ncbi:MAG: phytanoyl-CoA dioxygenase family protein, partial [Xanthobacteraceae bacterium]
PAHQDGAFFQNYKSVRMITLWIALSEVTRLSGALQFASVLPQCVLPHDRLLNSAFACELATVPETEFEAVELPSGGCVAHDAMAIHKSGPNETDRVRRAIAFCYRAPAMP